MVLQIIVIIAFIILGIIFSMGKGEFLIPGYGKLTKEERERQDMVALCKMMGKVVFAIAFIIAFFPLSEILQIKALYYIGVALSFLGALFVLNFLNKQNKGNK